ncbi:hypothetical protein DV36_00990 [Amycolatopsis mediterranei]|nr:hypothetical protein DV36_00990 [Amycolatopsis mediterranei]
MTGQLSWARNATIGATASDGMNGCPGTAWASSPRGSPPAIRVCAAGAMRLTLIPCGSPASFAPRARPMTPALAAAYDRLLSRPNRPLDVVSTIRP